MHQLSHVPSVRPLLEQIQAQLLLQGKGHAEFQMAAGDIVYAFDVLGGIAVMDHRTRQSSLNCVLCTRGHNLRYEFVITTLTGEQIRPVGSSCVFRRALGEQQALAVGRELESGLRRYQDELFRQDQQQRLTAAATWRDYLRELGFEAILLALATRVGVSPSLLNTLNRLERQKGALNRNTFEEVQQAVRDLEARQVSGQNTKSSEGAAPAAARFVEVAPPVALVAPGRSLKPKASAGQPMSPGDWATYLLKRKINDVIDRWEVIAPLLACPDPEKVEMLRSLRSRRPLSLDALTQLNQVKLKLQPSIPEMRRQVADHRDLRRVAGEEQVELQKKARERQRQRRAAAVARHNRGAKGALDHRVVDVLEDDTVKSVFGYWLEVREQFPLEVRQRLQCVRAELNVFDSPGGGGGSRQGLMREDDHRLVLDLHAVMKASHS